MRETRQPQDHAPVRASPVAPPSPAPPLAAQLLQLQRTAGNAAVGRALARSPSLMDDRALGGEYPAWYTGIRKDLETYRASGKKGPVTYDPSKRNKDNYYGGFDVSYDPAADKELLEIELRGVVDFLPSIHLVKGLAVAKNPAASLQKEAAAINKLPKADRAAAVAPYNWSKAGGPDAGDEAAFLTGFKSAVETAWMGRHTFVCTRNYWEDLAAEVDVTVDVVEMDAAHPQGSPYHMKVNAYKLPAGKGADAGADVSRPGGKKGAFANVMNVTSLDVDERTDELLTKHVGFDADGEIIGPQSTKRLEKLAKNMPNAPKDATVAVAGLTVKVQGKDLALRQKRFDKIVALLTKGKMDPGRITFEDAGAGDWAEVVIGTGDKQTVVAHESGHMFGLDDEYTGSGAYAPGKKVEHDRIAKQAGYKGIIHASSDSIMSGGREVREQHYVTFLDALKVVSGIEDWKIGTRRFASEPERSRDGLFEDPLGPF